MNELTDNYAFTSELSEAGLKLLEQQAIWRQAQPQDQIVCKGDRADGLILVSKGSLRVYNINPSGREYTLYWINPGQSCVIAMNCVYNNIECPVWVGTDEPTRYTMVPASTYWTLFKQEPSLQSFTFQELSRRVHELTSVLSETISLGVEERLASLLVRKADNNGCVNMSQESIANHLGTAREVVSRAVRSLVSQQLILSKRGSIQILDFENLSDLKSI